MDKLEGDSTHGLTTGRSVFTNSEVGIRRAACLCNIETAHRNSGDGDSSENDQAAILDLGQVTVAFEQ